MSDVRCIGSDLCEELAGLPDNSFHMIYEGDPPTRIIAGSDHLRLLADLSPLVAGHMLLTPLAHYLSFAHVVRDLHDELSDFLLTILPLYRKTFGSLTILEHGSSTNMNAAACITHAHWHLVPCDGHALDRLMRRDGLVGEPLESIRGLGELAKRDQTYFLCSHDSSHTVFGIGSTMRRQYLRSIVGELFGMEYPLWDYALVVRKNLLRETVLDTMGWRVHGGVFREIS